MWRIAVSPVLLIANCFRPGASKQRPFTLKPKRSRMRIPCAVRVVLSCLALSCLTFAQIRLDPNAAPPKPINETELIAQLTKALDKAVAADNFSGAVLLAKDGKPVFEKAYGLASKDYDAANQL